MVLVNTDSDFVVGMFLIGVLRWMDDAGHGGRLHCAVVTGLVARVPTVGSAATGGGLAGLR